MSDVAEADIEPWVYRDPDQARIEIGRCLMLKVLDLHCNRARQSQAAVTFGQALTQSSKLLVQSAGPRCSYGARQS